MKSLALGLLGCAVLAGCSREPADQAVDLSEAPVVQEPVAEASGEAVATSFDVPPVPQEQPAPSYPEAAKAEGLQGNTLVEVILDTEGRVEQATLVKTSRHPALDEAALAAARSWTFTPAEKNGVPVRARIVIPFEFALE